MSEPHPLDDPVRKAKVVRLLLILTPVCFVLCYLLSWVQGAETRICVLIGAVAAVMCAAAAGVIHLMGSKSWMALVAVKIALLLIGKR